MDDVTGDAPAAATTMRGRGSPSESLRAAGAAARSRGDGSTEGPLGFGRTIRGEAATDTDGISADAVSLCGGGATAL